MGSWFSLNRFLLLSLFLIVSISAFGHGDGDPKKNYEALSEFLNATFVEVEKEATEPSNDADPSRLYFRDLNHNHYSVSRSQLVDALIKSYTLVLEKHCAIHDCDGACHDEAAKVGKIKKFARVAWRLVTLPVRGFVEIVTDFPKHMSYLTGDIGVVPAILVGLVYLPYTTVTEFIEGTLMGQYHWACPLFQALFWGPALYAAFEYNLFKELPSFRGQEEGVMARFQRVFALRRSESNIRASLKELFYEELPRLFKRYVYGHHASVKDMIADNLRAKHMGFDTFIDGSASAVEANENARKAPVAVAIRLQLQGLYILRQYIGAELNAARESGHIGYWRWVRSNYYLGMLDKEIGRFHRALWVGSSDKKFALAEWRKKSFQSLQDALQALHSAIASDLSLPEVKTYIHSAREVVQSYARGKLPLVADCPENLQAASIL